MATQFHSIPAEPMVSIVVPAYNAEATLAETLASAAAQTHRQIEIIVIDDGSIDATAAIASAFCANEPRARLVRQNNRGVAAARNCGIALAQGHFVAPLDADDLWHPDKLSRQLAAASGAGFVYCWSRDIDPAGRVWRDGPQPRHTGPVFLRMVADNFVGNGSALLVRREAALAVGGYDETLRDQRGDGCADILFQLRLAERFAAAVAPGYLVGYRRSDDAMSADPRAMFGAWLAARQRLELTDPAVRTADRWGLARRRLSLAEALVRRGAWRECVSLTAASLSRDPLRGLLTIGRLLARRLSGRQRASAPAPFGELDPDRRWSGSGRAGALARLDARRHASLAKLERPPKT